MPSCLPPKGEAIKIALIFCHAQASIETSEILGRFWHLADNPVVPAFVRFRTTADKIGFRPAIVCPLMNQRGHAAAFAISILIEDIVHADVNRVDLKMALRHADISTGAWRAERMCHVSEIEILTRKVHVQILKFGRPVRGKAPFEARPSGPSRSRPVVSEYGTNRGGELRIAGQLRARECILGPGEPTRAID